MPRLSLYRPSRTADYKYLDNIIREQYTVGGLDIHIHKYAGVKQAATPSGDATQPTYSETNPLFIEDLLLLENRNREYEDDVYTMRGVYRSQDIDFDLSQFGLFMQNDTMFITFHYNDMIEHIGRKLMNGDVLEFPNLIDYHPLDTSIPKGLPRYYVINDASFASEGFSQTWQPHLWRVKAVPLVGSQEYKDILDQFVNTQGDIDTGDDGLGNGDGTLADYMCQHQKNLDINDAILTQAEIEVPLSGYDVSKFYIINYDEDGRPTDGDGITVDNELITADLTIITADRAAVSPTPTGMELGYLTGDGEAPNGFPVTPGVTFPPNALDGEYCLRLDYFPNRLFRFNGHIWEKVEDNIRTNLYLNGETQRSSFVNNSDTIETVDRGTIPSRQSLSDLLKPERDN
jgi:hypothetical protein